MIPQLSRLCAVLFVGTAGLHAAVDYVAIDDTNAIVTGVRSDSATSDVVVLTANYTTGSTQYAGLYYGSLAASATATSWNALTPDFSGQTVTAATFYGPNTHRYDPRIPEGSIVAVGSYKYAEGASGPAFNHGMLYEGPVAGGGTWTQLDATPLVGRGETLLNTICHSTMGNLVVGNYDTDLATGHAFIYNKVTGMWTELNPTGAASATAYGIWQNGGIDSTSYTIVGGYSDLNEDGVDQGYIVDYDSVTGGLTNLRTFNYDNQPVTSLISHFDGITGTPTGYNLTGDFVDTEDGLGAFFASVQRKQDGSFSEAVWVEIAFPGGTGTSGNTVVENHALGIFVTDAGTQSYIATVEPDQTGVAVQAKRNGNHATFTVTNTGNVASTFQLKAKTRIAIHRRGPKRPGSRSGRSLSISFTMGGQNRTNGIEKGKASVTLAPGAGVNVVERVKKKHRLVSRRTIHTTLTATAPGSVSADAKVQIGVDAG